MSKETAIRAVGLILSSYPSANREGIENFYKLATESLSEFPDPILNHLANPKTGIVAKCTFIPSIAELRKFCTDEMAARYRKAQFEDREEARKLHAPDPNPAVTKETQVRVAGMFKNLVRELNHSDGKAADEPLLTREEYQAKLEANLDRIAQEAQVSPPPKLSNELRRRVGLFTN